MSFQLPSGNKNENQRLIRGDKNAVEKQKELPSGMESFPGGQQKKPIQRKERPVELKNDQKGIEKRQRVSYRSRYPQKRGRGKRKMIGYE